MIYDLGKDTTRGSVMHHARSGASSSLTFSNWMSHDFLSHHRSSHFRAFHKRQLAPIKLPDQTLLA